jgi:protein ImuA
MSEKEAKLAALRVSLLKAELGDGGLERVPLGPAVLDACLQGGLCRGALHEIFAEPSHEAAATGFAMALCGRMAAQKPVLWIRTDFSVPEWGEIAPMGWLELGFDPARLLLLRVADAKSLIQAGHDALSCAALGAVVMESTGPANSLTLTASQRLTLEAARKGVSAFLLQLGATPQTSTAKTRWQVKARPSPQKDPLWGRPLFDAHLSRNRHGRTNRFALMWSSDHGLFQPLSDETDFGAVVSAASNRPAASARTG